MLGCGTEVNWIVNDGIDDVNNSLHGITWIVSNGSVRISGWSCGGCWLLSSARTTRTTEAQGRLVPVLGPLLGPVGLARADLSLS